MGGAYNKTVIEPAVLKKYPFFGGLVEEQIGKILPLMAGADFQENQVILAEGAVNDTIYFILEGRVGILRQGRQIAELAEGDTFGEMEVLDIMPAEASVTALSPVRTISISNRGLYEMRRLDSQAFSMILMNLARDLSRRLRRMDEKAVGESPAARHSDKAW